FYFFVTTSGFDVKIFSGMQIARIATPYLVCDEDKDEVDEDKRNQQHFSGGFFHGQRLKITKTCQYLMRFELINFGWGNLNTFSGLADNAKICLCVSLVLRFLRNYCKALCQLSESTIAERAD